MVTLQMTASLRHDIEAIEYSCHVSLMRDIENLIYSQSPVGRYGTRLSLGPLCGHSVTALARSVSEHDHCAGWGSERLTNKLGLAMLTGTTQCE